MSQLHHPGVELLQRLWTDELRPAHQRRVVGNRFPIQPTELAQHEAVPDQVLGLFVAPAVEPLDHQHPQEHLDRGAMPSTGPTLRAAPTEIRLDPLEEPVVLQQSVQLTQLWLERHRSLRDYLE